MLLLLTVSLSYPPSLAAPLSTAPQPRESAPRPTTDNYTLTLFSSDTVLRNPNSTVYGYVEIAPGTTITENALLDIWYSYSPTVRPDISAMSIELNGVPVSSRTLRVEQSPLSNWQVSLPAQQFRTGTNEIAISVIHRTIDGLCRDVDNAANWFIIRPTTRINFKAVNAPYVLLNYPKPFLNEYLSSKINTVVYLPENADNAMLSSLLNMAGSWGAKAPSGRGIPPQRLEVRQGQPAGIPANEVVFSLTDMQGVSTSSTKDVAELNLEQLPGGYTRLIISGTDTGAIAKAVTALNRPQLVKTFLGKQIVLAAPLPEQAADSITDIAAIARTKKGMLTFANLGYENDINVAGAFHQDVNISVPRPSNYSIGDGSYVELYFRHSKILDPKKSAVTVYINDSPVRSAALTVENAEKGVLKVPIPETELEMPFWNLRFGFYHDLGIIDCSKRYDEVAWSVIEKKSRIYLAPGKIKRFPDLADFPNNFFVSAGAVVNLTLLLPENPSTDEINTAFKMAYLIGQNNNSNIVWNVQTSPAYDVRKAPGAVIAIGKKDQLQRWQALKEYLSVYPDSDGFHVAPWLEILPATLNLFDIYQIGRISQDEEKYLYAFMYTDTKRVDNFFKIFLDKGNQLSGQVTLVDANGNSTEFKRNPDKSDKGVENYLQLVRELLEGSTAAIYTAVFAAVVLGTVLLMYFTRRR